MTWMPLAPLTTYVTRSRRRGACHTLGDAPFHSIGKRFIRDMSTRAFGHLLTQVRLELLSRRGRQFVDRLPRRPHRNYQSKARS